MARMTPLNKYSRWIQSSRYGHEAVRAFDSAPVDYDKVCSSEEKFQLKRSRSSDGVDADLAVSVKGL